MSAGQIGKPPDTLDALDEKVIESRAFSAGAVPIKYHPVRSRTGRSTHMTAISGRHLNIQPDGTVEMSADDAKYLIPHGWTKLAEWSRDEMV